MVGPGWFPSGHRILVFSFYNYVIPRIFTLNIKMFYPDPIFLVVVVMLVPSPTSPFSVDRFGSEALDC